MVWEEKLMPCDWVTRREKYLARKPQVTIAPSQIDRQIFTAWGRVIKVHKQGTPRVKVGDYVAISLGVVGAEGAAGHVTKKYSKKELEG